VLCSCSEKVVRFSSTSILFTLTTLVCNCEALRLSLGETYVKTRRAFHRVNEECSGMPKLGIEHEIGPPKKVKTGGGGLPKLNRER
jgi:hypothetical protein